MKTKAVRLYGQSDLRLEEFELPEIKDDEIEIEDAVDEMRDYLYNNEVNWILLGNDDNELIKFEKGVDAWSNWFPGK